MRPSIRFLVTLTIIFLTSPTGAQSDDLLPVVLVNMGRIPDQAEVVAAVKAMDSPTMRGAKISVVLGLHQPGAKQVADEALGAFERARNLFFSGDHEEARPIFASVYEIIAGSPDLMSLLPALRNAAFDAAVYLAIIGKNSTDEPSATNWLQKVADRFPDMEPAPSDFPPWVREEFAALKTAAGRDEGKLEMLAPPGCKFVVDGRELQTAGAVAGGLGIGPRSVRVLCHGRLSPVTTVVLGKSTVRYHPVLLSSSSILNTGEDIILEVEDGAERAAVVDDLLSLFRAGGWRRGVALVGEKEDLAVWLIDVDAAGIIRMGSGPSDKSSGTASSIVPDLIAPRDVVDGSDTLKKPWYRDGLAWTLVGAGLAALGTGVALGQVYGGPSTQEPAAWALILAGSTVTATGVVIFVIPDRGDAQNSGGDRELVVGLTGTWRF